MLDDNRYFDVFFGYAKATPEDILIRIAVENRWPGIGDRGAGHASVCDEGSAVPIVLLARV